jgi:hypothetical protein
VVGNILGALVHSIEADSKYRRFLPLLKELKTDKSVPAGDKVLQYLLACQLYGGLTAVSKPFIEVFVGVSAKMTDGLQLPQLAKYGPAAFTLAVEQVKADAEVAAAFEDLFAPGADGRCATLIKELRILLINKFFNTAAKVCPDTLTP